MNNNYYLVQEGDKHFLDVLGEDDETLIVRLSISADEYNKLKESGVEEA